MSNVVIDLFKKGDGLCCLKEIYNLSDSQITRIEDKVFEYATPPMPKKKIDELITLLQTLPGETEAEIKNVKAFLLDKTRLNRWPRSECVSIFLEETGIKPDIFDVGNVMVHCKHICSSIDHGESIRKYGLLKLTDLLEMKSPLSEFLRVHGIKVIPSECRIIVNGNETSISQSGTYGVLYSKLYHDNGEVEVFISGDEKGLEEYSSVYHYPEILCTLDQALHNSSNTLGWSWVNQKTETLMIQFDAYLDECIIHEMPSSKYDMQKYYALVDFLSCSYDEENIPHRFWENYWIIESCLENSTTLEARPEAYAAIKKDAIISADRLSIEVI